MNDQVVDELFDQLKAESISHQEAWDQSNWKAESYHKDQILAIQIQLQMRNVSADRIRQTELTARRTITS